MVTAFKFKECMKQELKGKSGKRGTVWRKLFKKAAKKCAKKAAKGVYVGPIRTRKELEKYQLKMREHERLFLEEKKAIDYFKAHIRR